MLLTNRGLSFDFVLGRLPRAPYDIFIDASTDWGIGGCCDNEYFMIPWTKLQAFEQDVIARKELLAALVALLCFSPSIKGQLVTLYTDNTNVRDWLAAGRSSKLKGLNYLALWELLKYNASCKTSVKWLPSSHNINADKLSRGITPLWLEERGRQIHCNLFWLAHSWKHVEEAWRAFN